MDMFSFAVLVSAYVGLALVFGMVLWSEYWYSPYLAKRIRRFLVGVVLTAASVLVLARPAIDEFWFGIQVVGFLAVVAGACGFFLEAFEPDRFWFNREMRRIAIRG